MKKVILSIKKHKIVCFVLFVLVFTFCYSHVNSYLLSSKVYKSVSSIEMISLELNDLDKYLDKLGYNVILTEENGFSLTALKDNERIMISSVEDAGIVNYEFYNTNQDVTPLLSDVKWQDSLSKTKFKLGINFFNTRYTSLRCGLDTQVYTGDGWILVMKNNVSEYAYEMDYNTAGELYRITVRKYN